MIPIATVAVCPDPPVMTRFAVPAASGVTVMVVPETDVLAIVPFVPPVSMICVVYVPLNPFCETVMLWLYGTPVPGNVSDDGVGTTGGAPTPTCTCADWLAPPVTVIVDEPGPTGVTVIVALLFDVAEADTVATPVFELIGTKAPV